MVPHCHQKRTNQTITRPNHLSTNQHSDNLLISPTTGSDAKHKHD